MRIFISLILLSAFYACGVQEPQKIEVEKQVPIDNSNNNNNNNNNQNTAMTFREAQSFIANYCVSCHPGFSGYSEDRLVQDTKIRDWVRSLAMPPSGANKPNSNERERFLQFFD